jgi:hypothetical protein
MTNYRRVLLRSIVIDYPRFLDSILSVEGKERPSTRSFLGQPLKAGCVN